MAYANTPEGAEKRRAAGRRWYHKRTPEQKEACRVRARAKYWADPAKAIAATRRSQIKNFYGLDLEQYDRMFKEQKALCYICGEPKPARGKSLSIDHDHKTGRVRKLLCRRCNSAIGYLRDDPELICKAAEYVATHKGLSYV